MCGWDKTLITSFIVCMLINRIIFYSTRIPIVEGKSIALVVSEFVAHENYFVLLLFIDIHLELYQTGILNMLTFVPL
jgi:hypothetical protein